MKLPEPMVNRLIDSSIPDELYAIEATIIANRPEYKNNGQRRDWKASVYREIVHRKGSEFLDCGGRYCGLPSVFFDKIFLDCYPLVCGADCFETDPSNFKRMELFYNNTIGKETRFCDYAGDIILHKADVLDLAAHNPNTKYKLIDIDSNGVLIVERVKLIAQLAIIHADTQCILTVWNPYARAITKEKHEVLVNFLDELLKKDFNIVLSGHKEYMETSPMYCKHLFLERK